MPWKSTKIHAHGRRNCAPLNAPMRRRGPPRVSLPSPARGGEQGEGCRRSPRYCKEIADGDALRPSHRGGGAGRGCGRRLHHQDRKSTRLNSSHLVISYAVFCLKKKKNTFHSLYHEKKNKRKETQN